MPATPDAKLGLATGLYGGLGVPATVVATALGVAYWYPQKRHTAAAALIDSAQSGHALALLGVARAAGIGAGVGGKRNSTPVTCPCCRLGGDMIAPIAATSAPRPTAYSPVPSDAYAVP
jgi:hypothetical protein